MPDCDQPPAGYPCDSRFGLVVLEDAGRITCVAREYSPVPVFALMAGRDPATAETGVDIIVRLLGSRGRAFSRADYEAYGVSLECLMAPGLDCVGGHDGRRDYLHLHGRHDDIGLALASVAFVVRSNHLREFQLQVIAADTPAVLSGRDWYAEKLVRDPQYFCSGPVLDFASVKVSVLGV